MEEQRRVAEKRDAAEQRRREEQERRDRDVSIVAQSLYTSCVILIWLGL